MVLKFGTHCDRNFRLDMDARDDNGQGWRFVVENSRVELLTMLSDYKHENSWVPCNVPRLQTRESLNAVYNNYNKFQWDFSEKVARNTTILFGEKYILDFEHWVDANLQSQQPRLAGPSSSKRLVILVKLSYPFLFLARAKRKRQAKPCE